MNDNVFINIPVTSVVVWLKENKKDKVVVQTKAPSPNRANSKEMFNLTFEIASKTGKAYVEKWFGVKPLVIDEKTSTIVQNFSAMTKEQAGAAWVAPRQVLVDKLEQEAPKRVAPVKSEIDTILAQQSKTDRSGIFKQPQASSVVNWTAMSYQGGKYFTLFGQSTQGGEWTSFLSKGTSREALSWFSSKGVTDGQQILAKAVEA